SATPDTTYLPTTFLLAYYLHYRLIWSAPSRRSLMFQAMCPFIPDQLRDRGDSVLVPVSRPVVLKEGKVAVRSWVHSYGRDCLRLLRALHLRPKRHNASGPHKQWERLD